MDIWNIAEYAAWAASALFGILIIADWLKVDSSYSEEVLTSSQEGELEALSEEHKI